MAISTVNAFYQGLGPTVTNEVLANYNSSPGAYELTGYCLPILDGSATTFTVNWIDGTATLPDAPKGILLSRNDPPAWKASTAVTVGQIALGSGHVQKVTTAGVTSTSAPTWSTAGSTVTDGSAVWTDLGAIALSTITPVSAITITNVSALITISAAGTSTQIPVITFKLIRG